MQTQPETDAGADGAVPEDDGSVAAAQAAARSLGDALRGVRQLDRDVAAGRVSLDPEVGGLLVNGLREQQATVEGWLGRASAMGRQPLLGTNPVGTAMAAKFSGRATGDMVSFVVVLRQYQQALTDAADAVEAAMRAYTASEDEGQTGFGTGAGTEI